MNAGTASSKECNPPAAGGASKCPAKDCLESPREKRHASTTDSTEDVNLTDGNGRSPLHHAAMDGDAERMRELIGRGADTRLQDLWGRTPLHWALLMRTEAAAELLTEADGRNDVQDDKGCTPLHHAAEKGYVTIIRKLLAGGSRTLVQDEWGRTPLHLALWLQKEAAAELLAEADGSNDVQDESRRTPLHLAALKGYQGIFRKLVLSGTNPHSKDRSVAFSLKLALRRWGRNDIIPKMILSWCAFKGIAINWEELQLREEDLQFCIEELSRCEAEILLMKRTLVPASSVSLHHLVTRHVGWVSPRFRGGVLRACRNFPVYADLIASELRKAEERRVLMDRCLDCFTLLAPPLPTTCVDIVLLCLSDGDLRNFVRGFRFDC